ncbi:hypothetical protein FB451DRAFT_1406568 [Mycena latifolia]|nr:hypothetical protein FB451DRAFT_1406568 [Mycena latifolia]
MAKTAQLEEYGPDPSGPRKMHRALKIAELVDLIFSHLDPKPGAESGTLAALAGTCTIFHDSALDVLWRHQETIINLIQCMPANLWDSVQLFGRQNHGRKTLRLARPIIGTDWDRLLKYSACVKSLICADRIPYPDLSEVFDAIQLHFAGAYLLPNLEILQWGDRNPTRITLFLGPRISSIDLGYCNANTQRSLLPTLGSRYPGLRSVSMTTDVHLLVPDAPNHVSSFVRTLTRVKFLQVGTIDVAALRHLGRLHTLETLNVVLPESHPSPLAPEGTMFNHLCSTNVTVRHGQIDVLTAFVCTWAHPPIHTIHATVSRTPTIDGIREFLRVLNAQCAHGSLEVFGLTISHLAEWTFQQPHHVKIHELI